MARAVLIDRLVADNELRRWLERLGVDAPALSTAREPGEYDDDEDEDGAAPSLPVDAVEAARAQHYAQFSPRIVRAIQYGDIEVDGDQLTFALTRPCGPLRKMTFGEPDGAILVAMDQHKEGHNQSKTIAGVARWANEPESLVRKMKLVDLGVVEALIALFQGLAN